MNILIIQGHPDPAGRHYGHALAEAYAAGAIEGGHEVRTVTVAQIDFPLLRSKEEWDNGPVPEAIKAAQADIAWANHLLIVYPLWLGALPALLKGFLEQVFRPGFATEPSGSSRPWTTRLKGRSARIVVTMGMPAWLYRWWFMALTLRSLELNILDFVGIGPNRHTLIGNIEGMTDAQRKKWLQKMTDLGRRGR